jgi:hypothetical protein
MGSFKPIQEFDFYSMQGVPSAQNIHFEISNEAKLHQRIVTNDFLGFLGQIGGVLEIFLFIFGLLLSPLSEQSYTLKIMKNLFYARTSEDKLLGKAERRTRSRDGKMRKEVRFEFDHDDIKNKNIEQ